MRSLAVLVVVVAALDVSGIAAADDTSVTSSLSWTRLPGADECIATAPLARAVETRLGRAVFVSPSQADVSIEGRVERVRRRARWRAVLVATNDRGETIGRRELETDRPECSALDESLVLVIALMIDPNAESQPPQRAPPQTLHAPPPPTAPPPPRVVRAPTPRWRFAIRASGVAALGLLPGVAPGLAGSLFVHAPGAWPIEVGGAWLPTQTAHADNGAAARAWMAWGGLSLCPRIELVPSAPRLALDLCLGADVGLLSAEAIALDRATSGDHAIVLVHAMPRLVVRLVGPLAAHAGLAAAAAIVRPRVVYTIPPAVNGTSAPVTKELFSPWPVALIGDLGLDVELD